MSKERSAKTDQTWHVAPSIKMFSSSRFQIGLGLKTCLDALLDRVCAVRLAPTPQVAVEVAQSCHDIESV